MRHPNTQYLQTAVETATPTRRLVMLYDGAIRFLSQALPAMQARDYETQTLLIGKAQAIIAYMQAILDFQAGGEVAHALNAVYIPMYDALTDANIHDRRDRVEHVIFVLRELREAWIEVDRQLQAGKSIGREAGAAPELVAA